METLSICGFQLILWSNVTHKKSTCSIVLLFILILYYFSTLRFSIFELNLVVIFDIPALICGVRMFQMLI